MTFIVIYQFGLFWGIVVALQCLQIEYELSYRRTL